MIVLLYEKSESISSNEACTNTSANIFGSMLGVASAAQGLSQAANSVEVSYSFLMHSLCPLVALSHFYLPLL